jgi:hypothetical protein
VSLLTAARARYIAWADGARRQARLNLQGTVHGDFRLGEWSNRTAEAYAVQWSGFDRRPNGGWDWVEIHRKSRTDPSAFELVIWAPDNRLCCLAYASTTPSAVVLNYLEGDPRPDCPFRGVRTLIVMEAIQCYGQAAGRREIRIQPVNEALETLYREIYGFELATPKGGSAYYRREIA